jgi:hypothetical protein
MRLLADGLFRVWVKGHLHRFFPEACTSMTSAELASRIESTLERARSYGILQPADACRFLDVSFVLGAQFDSDPALTWARDILTDPQVRNGEMRMDLLQDATVAHLKQSGSSRTEDAASQWAE